MEREAVRMETQKLISSLKNACGGPEGISMCKEAANVIKILQAELEQAKTERDAAVKELQKTKSVAFKAETSNGLCSGKLTTY